MDVKTEIKAVEQIVETSSPLWTLAGIAALLLIVLVVLIIRAQKAGKKMVPADKQAKDFSPVAILQWAKGVLRRGVRALKYLSTRKEWRYTQPWVISIGEKGAGKTSIAHSLSSGYRQEVLLRERDLSLSGTEWRFYNGGVLIDVEGKYSASKSNSLERSRWHGLLEQLVSHRPERPIDSVVVTISASSLLNLEGQALQALEEDLYRQLFDIQKIFSFNVPVYVVVSQCDVALPGFGAFWQALDNESRDGDMFGWSNPYPLQNNFISDWVHQAFSEMADSLQWAQTQAAANETIGDSDQFFLFPEQFRDLQKPVVSVLEHLFKPSAYHASFYFRGIYFTGDNHRVAHAETNKEPLNSVMFVDDVFDQKVFAETNLARPTKVGRLSRNKTIRRFQIAALVALAISFVVLGVSAVGLNKEVDAVVAALQLAKNPEDTLVGDESCDSGDTVYRMLTNVSQIETGFKYYAIPASWFFGDFNEGTTKLVSEVSFGEVIFPSLRCHLEKKAKEIVNTPMPTVPIGLSAEQSYEFYTQAFLNYVDQVKDFEQALVQYRDITKYSRTSQATPILDKFSLLANYLYGKPVPKVIFQKQGLHRQAIALVTYDQPVVLPDQYVKRTTNHINALASKTRKVISDETLYGIAELKKVSKGTNLDYHEATSIESWASWVKQDWVGATDQDNPCQAIYRPYSEAVKTLTETTLSVEDTKGKSDVLAGIGNYQAQDFSDSLALFSNTGCYQKTVRELAQQQVVPIGNLFSDENGSLQVKAETQVEVEGFTSLLKLDYMKLSPKQRFVCETPLSGWNVDYLEDASERYKEYAAFVKALGASDTASTDQRLLYDQAARRQLNAVMDSLIYEAQTPMSFAQLNAAGFTVTDMIADESRQFAQSKDSLLLVLQIYEQMGFTESHEAIANCARNMALDVLQTVSTLAQSSYLYIPQLNPKSSPSGVDKLFSGLNTQAKATSYLSSQLLRAGVLAKIADPYVSFLKSTSVFTGTPPKDQQNIDYWDNTITEVNQKTKYHNSKGQVGQIDSFISGVAAEITYGDCGEKLSEYKPAAYGNDLFSDRRQELVENSEHQCADHGESEAFAQYKKLGKTFNAQLAGRYPFDLNAKTEASLASVKAFFDSYRDERESLNNRLALLTGKKWVPVKTFMKDLDQWADFFDQNLSAEGTISPVEMSITFRAFAKSNDGSDQVLNWTLNNGTDDAVYPNGATTLAWMYGEPLDFSLQWAEGSALKPLSDPAQSDMAVNGLTAQFDYTGNWALFRLIDGHVPAEGVKNDPLNPDNVVLQFKVPTQNKNASLAKSPKTNIFYLSIGLKGKNPETKKTTVVSWPGYLPDSAPVIW